MRCVEGGPSRRMPGDIIIWLTLPTWSLEKDRGRGDTGKEGETGGWECVWFGELPVGVAAEVKAAAGGGELLGSGDRPGGGDSPVGGNSPGSGRSVGSGDMSVCWSR